MRARIFAIFILIILLVIPLSLYYYITTQKVANITIIVGEGNKYSAKLSGTFGINGLPLADKALIYEKDCTDICVFSPVIPARYTLTLMSSGKTTLTDVIILNTGDKITRSYSFTDDIITTLAGKIIQDDSQIVSMIDNARIKNIGEFTPVGMDIMSRIWVKRLVGNSTQIGILSPERFIPVRSIITPILSTGFDQSRSVLIVALAGDRILFVPADLSNELEIYGWNKSDIIAVSPGKIWKIRTQGGITEIRGGRFIDDIRFTDSIDISPKIRIGYIDKNDPKKLGLSNFPSNTSILVRLDRTTGENLVLRRGVDIGFFFFYNEKPAYVDLDKNIFTLDGNK